MTTLPFKLALVAASASLFLSGCGSGKQDAQSELDKAANTLTQAEPAQPAPAPAPQPAAPAPAIIQEKAQPTTAATPAQSMQQAITAYKAGELEDAVTRLHRLRATPALTPEQRMAVQDSVAAVMSEIYELAAKGNPKAIAAVKQYERMQTARR